MNKLNHQSSHEIAKLESKYKFLYFLCDIGIKSAGSPATEAWVDYVFIQGQLAVGELCFS